MPRGFIRDKLQLKLLILYILNQFAQPVSLSLLTELVLCDEGVDYFSFSDALSELKTTGHVSMNDECFSITGKGSEHVRICESNLPYSVRMKCDRNAKAVQQEQA